jgi:hypothetical protein
MSNVTNVMVLVSKSWDDSRLMKSLTLPSESRRWRGALACITNEDAFRYWVQNSKGPECDVWVGAFNHFNRKAFIEDLQAIPWSNPGAVQVLILGQEDDCWGLWMFRDGQLQEVRLPGTIRSASESETLENGAWIRIQTGILSYVNENG